MKTTQNSIGNHYLGYFKPSTQKNPLEKAFFFEKIALEKSAKRPPCKFSKNTKFSNFFVGYHTKITSPIDSPSIFTPSNVVLRDSEAFLMFFYFAEVPEGVFLGVRTLSGHEKNNLERFKTSKFYIY